LRYMQEVQLEAEQAILGAILISPEIFRLTRVHMDDFVDPRNRKIFQAMGELEVDGQPIDYQLIYQKLQDRDLMLYMIQLAEHGIPVNWKYYDRKVREYSCKRQLAELAVHLGYWAKNGNQPKEVIEKTKVRLKELEEHITDVSKSMQQQVSDWVVATKGVFYVTDCYAELGLVTSRDKASARKALSRLVEDGVIKPHSRRRGCYRLVETDYEAIDHVQADDTPLDIILPFGLHKHMEWFPKGMAVVAGDTDAGKTTVLLNLAHDNQGKFPRLVYIATEMGPALLKRRLIKFCNANDYSYPGAIEGISFRAPKTANYMDLIDPDALNILDYYELAGDQFTEVSSYFRQIYDRLNQGVAFIAIQKKFGSALGRAAEMAMEKPLLYLTLNRGGIARIEKCKTEWTPDFQPFAIEYQYKIVAGGKLIWGIQPRSQSKSAGGK